MEIIFADFDPMTGELLSVNEGFENFAASQRWLADQVKNFIPDTVAFIAPTLDQCWGGLGVFITHSRQH